MTFTHCDPAVKLCENCLRAWLDRKPAAPEPDRESDFEAWQRWFKESGNADYWAKVACIECELGRRCLKTPRCEGAEPEEPEPGTVEGPNGDCPL